MICQITIFCDNQVQSLFYHSMTEFVFLNSQQLNNFLKAQESELPFSHKSDVSITHEQNNTCMGNQMVTSEIIP